MALVGNMIATAIGGNPSIVNYCMFVAVFSMLSVVYQIAALHSESFVIMSFIPIVVDALNTLFFLAGGIALAAYLQVYSCTDTVSFVVLLGGLARLRGKMLIQGSHISTPTS